jgi:hypothetical protein
MLFKHTTRWHLGSYGRQSGCGFVGLLLWDRIVGQKSVFTRLSKSSHLLGVTPYKQKAKFCEKIVDNLAIARAESIVQDVELS